MLRLRQRPSDDLAQHELFFCCDLAQGRISFVEDGLPQLALSQHAQVLFQRIQNTMVVNDAPVAHTQDALGGLVDGQILERRTFARGRHLPEHRRAKVAL